MKLVEDLFKMYKQHLSGDEEDADIITFAVLEQLSKEDLLEMIHEMKEQELYDLIGLYLREMLKGKMAKEGIINQRDIDFRNFH